ncbi:MAG TPA: hypothetical protein VJ958_05355 [Atribacterota bacterium]|nr:hypothetical protein [Atribacterota bacterium]
MAYKYGNGTDAKTFFKVFAKEYDASSTIPKPRNVSEIAAQCGELPDGGVVSLAGNVSVNNSYSIEVDGLNFDTSSFNNPDSLASYSVLFKVDAGLDFTLDETAFTDVLDFWVVCSYTDDSLILYKITSSEQPFQIGAVEDDFSIETTPDIEKYDTLGNKITFSDMVSVEFHDLASTAENYDALRGIEVVDLYTIDWTSNVQHGSFVGNLKWNIYKMLSQDEAKNKISVENRVRQIDDIVTF